MADSRFDRPYAGFGARKLYEDDTINAKYINTPDTQLYRKTQVLYGIDLAKSGDCEETPGGDRRRLYRCDGHASGRHRHGGRHVRTAFGAEHAKIIRRLIADDSLGAVQLVGP